MTISDTRSISVPPIIVRRDGDVVTLRFNRPRSYHALSTSLLEALAGQLDRLRAPGRILVLAGGDAAFSIGADITEMAAMDGAGAEAYSLLAHAVLARIEAWPGITVAILHGYVIGAGLELALGCDLIAAGPTVRIGMPGLAWALVPVMGGLRRLATRCSPAIARSIFLEGAILEFREALLKGLIHRSLEHEHDLERLLQEAREWSPSAVAAIRDLRLAGLPKVDISREAGFFAYGFRNGECQRRLNELMGS